MADIINFPAAQEPKENPISDFLNNLAKDIESKELVTLMVVGVTKEGATTFGMLGQKVQDMILVGALEIAKQNILIND